MSQFCAPLKLNKVTWAVSWLKGRTHFVLLSKTASSAESRVNCELVLKIRRDPKASRSQALLIKSEGSWKNLWGKTSETMCEEAITAMEQWHERSADVKINIDFYVMLFSTSFGICCKARLHSGCSGERDVWLDIWLVQMNPLYSWGLNKTDRRNSQVWESKV